MHVRRTSSLSNTKFFWCSRKRTERTSMAQNRRKEMEELKREGVLENIEKKEANREAMQNKKELQVYQRKLLSMITLARVSEIWSKNGVKRIEKWKEEKVSEFGLFII